MLLEFVIAVRLENIWPSTWPATPIRARLSSNDRRRQQVTRGEVERMRYERKQV